MVVLFVVDEPFVFELLLGSVMVVLRVVDVFVVDHGCQAKSAIRTATITINVMPIAAPLLPPSSLTITGSLMCMLFSLRVSEYDFPCFPQAQTPRLSKRRNVTWSVLGLVASGSLAIFALLRSRTPGGYYDADVYGMTPAAHRTYAAIAGVFFVAFIFTCLSRAGTIGTYIFAAFVLFALFYLTSFLRGAHEDDG